MYFFCKGIEITNCFDDSHKRIKAVLLLATCDLAARRKIQEMNGYGSYYGCNYCHIEGEFLNNAIHYPAPETAQERRRQLVLRTLENVLRDYDAVPNICYLISVN